jgi:hypothetical protein
MRGSLPSGGAMADHSCAVGFSSQTGTGADDKPNARAGARSGANDPDAPLVAGWEHEAPLGSVAVR